MMQPEQVKEILNQGFNGAEILVEDLTGTRDHYRVVIVSDTFIGKRLIQRHQMVNEVLKEPLKGPIHALTIETHTSEEWQKKAAAQAPAEIQFMRHPVKNH